MAKAKEHSKETLKAFIRDCSIKDFKTLRAYLLKVVSGKEMETKPIVAGGMVKCPACEAPRTANVIQETYIPVSAQIRVQAAKALKELEHDKFLGDVKETPKDTSGDTSTTDAIAAVAKKKEAEKAAEKAGKLKRIGESR